MNNILWSLKKNKIGIMLMIVSSICACIGQLFWKLSASQGLLVMLIGFVFYGVGALVMLIAYRFGSLSVLQPMLSLNYAISIILSVIVLHESVTVFKVVGVIIIMCGVTLIAGGDSK